MLIPGMPHKRHQAFSEFGNIDQPALPRGYVLHLLEADCGTPHYTRLMANLVGFDLVRLPGTDRRRGTGAGVRAIKESAEAISAVSDVTALGGELDEGLRQRALREAREAIDALLEEIAWLEAAGRGEMDG